MLEGAGVKAKGDPKEKAHYFFKYDVDHLHHCVEGGDDDDDDADDVMTRCAPQEDGHKWRRKTK